MSPLRLDAAALGTLEDHLPFPKAHLLDHLLGGVSLRHGPLQPNTHIHTLEDRKHGKHKYRVGEHRSQVGGERQEGTRLEQHDVDDAVDGIRGGQQYDVHHHELGVEYEEPGHDGTYYPADVPDAPHLAPAAPVVHVDFLAKRRVLVLHHFNPSTLRL